MKEIKKIGLLTSGGDCGGLNAALIGAIYMANRNNIEVVMIPNGYAGLYNIADLVLKPVDINRVEKIFAAEAGSEAGHSRVKISKIIDDNKYEKIKQGLIKHSIDALIIAGGDDTGSVVVDLFEQGINCIHVPKTMDLDLQTYSVGGDSTINRISRFAQELRTTAQTHNRALIIEVFGRYAGHTAFRGGLGADVDCILIPEVPIDFEVVYKDFKEKYMRRISNSDVKAGTYLIVCAEGLKNSDGNFISDDSAGVDSFGHTRLAGAAKYTRKQLEKFMFADPDWKPFLTENGIFVEGIYTHPEIREVQLGHLVRAGESSTYDAVFGKQCGASAVLLLMQGIIGVTVVGLEGDKVKYIPTKEAIVQRHVDLNEVSFYENLGVCFGRNKENFIPKFEKQEGQISRYL